MADGDSLILANLNTNQDRVGWDPRRPISHVGTLAELDEILTAATGLDTRVDSLSSADLASGVSTIPRRMNSSAAAATLASGGMRLTYFTPPASFTSSQVRMLGGGTAAGATPTLVRAGLYSIAGDGAATLVASTASDTALFAAANTVYTKSWSAPVALAGGNRYALGILCVTAAVAPTLVGSVLGNASASTEAAIAPRLSGSLNSQTDLPESFADASLVTHAGLFYVAVLP